MRVEQEFVLGERNALVAVLCGDWADGVFTAYDLSTAVSIDLCVIDPLGNTYTWPASDGGSGLATYLTASADLNVSGKWLVEARVQATGVDRRFQSAFLVKQTFC